MKLQTLPWIPLYYRDFLATTMGWSTTERGAYALLLFAQWESALSIAIHPFWPA